MEATDTTALATTDQAIVADELVNYGEDKFIDREDIRPSKTNRKFFNLAKLQELAANFKLVGILQRILVRPVDPTEEEPQPFEIVYGERRWIAAGMADINSIPCNVKTLTDDQAAMIQIFENLHKENPHPLEEAMGYQNLMMSHGYTADALVKELSVTRSYFYSRLKLCDLAASLHQDFMNDRFPASIALLIARIPVPDLQIKAAQEVAPINGNPENEPMSARAAARHIKTRYTLDLQGVVFNIHDEKLHKEAGSCMKCPKRTGNQKEVFTDISSDFICTDPDCFAEKRAAHDAKIVAAASKKGVPVYEGDDAIDFLADEVRAELSDKLFCFDRITPTVKDFNATIETLLDEKQRPDPIAYIKDDAGLVTPVYSQTAMQAALEKAGICFAESEEDEEEAEQSKSSQSTAVKQVIHSGTGITSPLQEDQIAARTKRDDERRETASKETKARVAIYKRLRELVAEGLSLPSLREFAKQLFIAHSLPDDVLYDIYQFDINDDEQVWAYIDQATMVELQLFLLDLILTDDLVVTSWNMDRLGSESDTFNTVLAIARAEGIDPDQVRYELENPAAVAQSDEPAQQAIKTPAKRGRKPKAAAQPQPDLITPESDSGQPDTADANAPAPVDMPPVKTPGKRGPKPKQKESDSAAQGTISPVEAWPFPRSTS